ncbi:CYFA0S14e02894g1_1 [Cyberlindnera fabianii]|uniref:CYFA0S14e02894g1_1 n=1 Tax=Cyberlindnera fabianii TaxID=36022 RepID=A0A061B3D6_CYBFA|nr:Retinol dehydrogenase 10-B [Cyberlindnera fabianii]CDR44457.1 CYFA0S14e02894g1_1 [Cyberlindnera fabianii]
MHFKAVAKSEIRKSIVAINRSIDVIHDCIIGTVLEKHQDIVLVTGGGSGLGREIVRELKARHIPKVIVFDINIPNENSQIPGVHYFKCDISDKEKIQKLSEKIQSEIGIVTVVINNAGIASGKSLLELSFEEIDKMVKVNMLSSFYMVKTFLPNMLLMKRGYIVSVASVLGYMTPSRLTAYGAAKSGMIAFHESLSYELGPPLGNDTGVKTLLVCPGQLKTPMFKGVNTPSNILAPELEPSYVAQKIVRAIECGRRGEIQMPFYGHFLPLFRALPWPITQFARLLSGMDESMTTFGHNLGRADSKDITNDQA